jgi:hypothetical protein
MVSGAAGGVTGVGVGADVAADGCTAGAGTLGVAVCVAGTGTGCDIGTSH